MKVDFMLHSFSKSAMHKEVDWVCVLTENTQNSGSAPKQNQMNCLKSSDWIMLWEGDIHKCHDAAWWDTSADTGAPLPDVCLHNLHRGKVTQQPEITCFQGKWTITNEERGIFFQFTLTSIGCTSTRMCCPGATANPWLLMLITSRGSCRKIWVGPENYFSILQETTAVDWLSPPYLQTKINLGSYGVFLFLNIQQKTQCIVRPCQNIVQKFEPHFANFRGKVPRNCTRNICTTRLCEPECWIFKIKWITNSQLSHWCCKVLADVAWLPPPNTSEKHTICECGRKIQLSSKYPFWESFILVK